MNFESPEIDSKLNDSKIVDLMMDLNLFDSFADFPLNEKEIVFGWEIEIRLVILRLGYYVNDEVNQNSLDLVLPYDLLGKELVRYYCVAGCLLYRGLHLFDFLD